MSKTLDRIRKLPWVHAVDDERGDGSSIIVTLEEGYEFANHADCGVQGFDTVRDTKSGTTKSAVILTPESGKKREEILRTNDEQNPEESEVRVYEKNEYKPEQHHREAEIQRLPRPISMSGVGIGGNSGMGRGR